MDANYKPYNGYPYNDEFKCNVAGLLESSDRALAEFSGVLGIPDKSLERQLTIISYDRKP